MPAGKVYIVEHLDEELGPWSELEYIAIAKETQQSGGSFCLSSLPAAFPVPETLKAVPAFRPEARSVEDIYADDKSRVCLLDPAAATELEPEDGERFDAFLFGGILGRLGLFNAAWPRRRDECPETDGSKAMTLHAVRRFS